jgi:hypothetical protein
MPDDYLKLARQHKERLAEGNKKKQYAWRQEELPFKQFTSEEFMELFFSKLMQLNWKIDRDRWLVLVCPECDRSITKVAIIEIDDNASIKSALNVDALFKEHKPKCKAVPKGEE